MPANVHGVHIDAAPYNASDGFSPGQAIVVKVPGLDNEAALRRTGEALATNVIRMLDGFVEGPTTLVHGDYRADNLFFGGAGQGAPALAAVDWQVSSRGAGAFDLAYFLSGNVSTEVRRSIEMDLLKHYTDILRENGVRDFPDPGPQGGYDLSGTGIGPGDTRLETAMAACRDETGQNMRIAIGG